MRKTILIFILLFSIKVNLNAQKVGLVLSGGGADALAHIGVIKALEDNKISINYITGTSMGAMIGALYASGIPIRTIEQYFTSTHFLSASNGEIPTRFQYYFPKPTPTPSLISLRLKKSETGYSLLLPSKIISSETFDFDAIKYLAEAEKNAHYNFDSLMIPFRCVAADIVTKQLVVFKDGSLTEALRASMSYPFFVRPIKIDNHLMYDGGIYNNFPVDVMCSDFKPDFIIGSNVSKNTPPPSEDDILGQLQHILVKNTNYDIYCTESELIEPHVDFGTFSFENAQQAVDSGYYEALKHINHIKHHLKAKSIYTAIQNKYNESDSSIIIGQITFKGLNTKQAKYAGSVLNRKRKKASNLSFQTFERNYYRLFQESYIEDIRTKLTFNNETQKYDATVNVSPIKSLTLDLGGNIASRPITEGYAHLEYNNLSTFGFKLGISTHYGKMYQALNAYAQFNFPAKFPVYIKPKFVIHKWNWFESRQSNLFVSEKPNYIIEGELYSGLEIGIGIGDKFKLSTELTYLQLETEYYQTPNFSPSDTADATRFNGINSKIELSSNNLNRIQLPYKGNFFLAQLTLTNGNEIHKPGSTSIDNTNTITSHSILQLKVAYQAYIKMSNKFKIGTSITGVISSMGSFQNYTSTVIFSPSFKPTPDSKTLFLESFHANKFAALGFQFVYLPITNLQIRAEMYGFQPYQSYQLGKGGNMELSEPFSGGLTILSGTISYRTPLGPLSFSVNYYYNNPDISPESKAPITVLLNFGYIIFNKSAYH